VQTIAYFNHKGGVGKTTMLFNAAIEMNRLGMRVLMVDLDAQANLTAISLPDENLGGLVHPSRQWTDRRGCVQPSCRRFG
jgi:cellulose biosynthesis protein BcsQ